MEVERSDHDMATETVKSIARKVADGTMDPAEAGRRIKSLVTIVRPPKNDAERMARYREGQEAAAIETDPNSFMHMEVLYLNGTITRRQMDAIREGMGGTSLSDGDTEYFLAGDAAARKVGDRAPEVFSAEGWTMATGTETLVPCTEEEALAAAKALATK